MVNCVGGMTDIKYYPLALTGVYTPIQNIHLYTREHSPTHTHILRNEGHRGCLGKEGLGF